ncbi:TolC family protein [Phenylobacterium sp.]|uniref:TolC family protein n=1 Tax=Phenylobacterium sp. TaxID=1871053 RepID=UPI0025E21BC1|nr:TolC family protein [Phenylobacterium sp.]
MSRAWVLAGAAVTLAGCVHYTPAPPHPERFAATLEARRLDEKPPGATWSGADLLAAALARNPRVAEARAKYATALAAARTAKLMPGLTLTLTAEYADEHPHWGGGAAADIPLDTVGRRGARVTTADLQALQAWYDYGEAVWAVRTALEKARVDLDGARLEAGLTERAVALRRERLERLARRVSAGEDERTLALTAQTELAAAERRRVDAQGRETQAVVDLAKALGVAPAAARDLLLASAEEPPPLNGLPQWRRDAALSRSDVLRTIADYDLAENALRLEVAKQYPEVRLGPGYMYDHGVNKLPFSLALVLPTYDLNQRAIAQAEAARAAAGRALDLTQANALAAVDTAAGALATARANLDRVSARELPAARRAQQNTARSVRAGEADRVDDLAAQAAELDAELNLLDARRAARTAGAELEDALRRSFDPAETAVLQTTLTRPGGAP